MFPVIHYTIGPILCKPFIFNIVDLGFRLFYKVHYGGLDLPTIELLTQMYFFIINYYSVYYFLKFDSFLEVPHRNIFSAFSFFDHLALKKLEH